MIGTELSGSWNDVAGSGNCFTEGRKPFRARNEDGGFDTFTKDCSDRQKWTVNWLNKIGVTHDRLLVYLTGGVAVTQVDKTRSFEFTSTGETGTLLERRTAQWSGDQTHIGVVLGGGLQYAIGHNVSLGVEYLRTTYASADYMTHGTNSSFSSNCDAVAALVIDTSCSSSRKIGANAIQDGYSDTIRAVLNYKFGDHERVPLK